MLTGIHILLTYKCNLECAHCFLYSSPNAKGTMTLRQIRCVLAESRKITSVEWIYFEGGEPFLIYPSLLEGRCMLYKNRCKAHPSLPLPITPVDPDSASHATKLLTQHLGVCHIGRKFTTYTSIGEQPPGSQ